MKKTQIKTFLTVKMPDEIRMHDPEINDFIKNVEVLDVQTIDIGSYIMTRIWFRERKGSE